MWRHEQLPESAIHIVHPACGGEVCICSLEMDEDVLRAEAICYRCDTYVYLEYRRRLGEDPVPTRGKKGFDLRALKEETVRAAFAAT